MSHLRPRARQLPWALGFWSVLASGCPRTAGPSPTPPPGDTETPPVLVSSPDEAAPTPNACGSEGLAVGTLDWLPASTRAAIVVELHAADLQPALQRLGAHARGTGHGLPIDLAFSLGQWGWQIPALKATLARAGLHPASLAFVRSDEPVGGFVISHDCDVDELKERTAHAWGIEWRGLVEGAIGRAPAGASSFAWDVVLLPGQRLLLVEAGRGDAWARALARRPAGTEAGGERLGDALARVEAAPVRGVVTGHALVDPSAGEAVSGQTLRATTDTVEVGGSLPAPP